MKMFLLFLTSVFATVNFVAGNDHIIKLGQTLRVKDFSWKNCGGSTAVFTDLSLSPDPLQFPGTLTISAGLNISQTLTAALPASLLIEKSVLGKFVKIPCIDNFGSCDYDDLCALLDQITQCPDPLVAAGIPCQCPFKSASYKLPPADFDVDAAFLPAGDYHVKGSISSGGTEVGCLEFYASVSD